MSPRRPSAEHQEAVSRRLALLSAELSATGPPTYAMDETHTRVAARPEPPVPVPEPEPVPMPGRHASRRPGRVVADVLPETVRGRVALGPGPLAVVAVLVALGLAVTAWWVVRADAHEVAAPVVVEPAAGLATPAASAAASQTIEEVTVDVAGKVRRPGIAVLPAGSRVVDAIEAAGGARRGVDLGTLNLARVLVDGEQVLVGTPTPVGVVGSTAATPGAVGALVNLNTAAQAELETLPDVGPVTAQAILAWRTEHGGFTAVEELLEVDGIGEATLATITPHVTV